MDEAVFLQILNSLLEKAKKKKNELDYGDINDGRSLRISGSEEY